MKKILAVVFALIVAGHVNAKGIEPNSPVGMSVLKSGSIFKLFYRGEQVGKVRVKIYNEDGQVVFSETLQNTENFMRPYNFSVLPEGEYVIALSDKQATRTQKVSHKRSSPARIAHLTRLDNHQCKYMLAVPNDGRDALTVRIYDEKLKMVYQDTQIINGDFAKVYNLDRIDGDHTFEIIDRDGRVTRLSKAAR